MNVPGCGPGRRERVRRNRGASLGRAMLPVVRRAIPFRDAHEIVGRAVAYAIAQDKDLAELDLATLQGFSPCIDADIFQVLTLEGSVASRNHLGGTAPAQVRAAILRVRTELLLPNFCE